MKEKYRKSGWYGSKSGADFRKSSRRPAPRHPLSQPEIHNILLARAMGSAMNVFKLIAFLGGLSVGARPFGHSQRADQYESK